MLGSVPVERCDAAGCGVFKLSGLLVNHRLQCSYELAWLLIDGMLLGAASIGVAVEVVAILIGATVMR